MRAMEMVPKMNKEFPHSVREGMSLRDMTVPRLPSGCFSFDLITGGGLPMSRISVLHGDKSSGKSTFALRVAGNFQKLHPNEVILYVDFENTFDYSWAKNFLNPEKNFVLISPDYGEQGIDMVKAFATKTSDVGLIIVDSLASIIPTAEAEAGATENPQIGLQVKQINRMIRGLLPPMTMAKKMGRDMTILFVNQVRANMNAGKFGAQTSQPGGKYLGHVASLDCRFYAKEYKKKGTVTYGVMQSVVVDKNKVGLPKRSTDFMTYLTNYGEFKTGDVDELKTIVAYAKRAGLVERVGTTWKIKLVSKNKKEDTAPLEYGKLDELYAALKENPKLLAKVKSITLRTCIENPVVLGDAQAEDGV
jgi:protein RecA